MDISNKLYEINGEKIYVIRGIYEFLDEKNFHRLLREYAEAKSMELNFM